MTSSMNALLEKLQRVISAEMLRQYPDVFYFEKSDFIRIMDDVLTLLIHLGYLSYNWEEKTVRIPNKEVATEYVNSIEEIDSFSEVARSVEASKKCYIEGSKNATQNL